jgi:replicative DNA helicase
LHFGGIVTNVVAIGEEVLQYHRRVQNASELLGIPSGFPALDDSMGGMQAGDLIVITGRPGLGKSYILLRMALEAYLQGRRVLFITMEMTNRQCVSRLLALKTRVQHSRLRKGLLSAYALNLVRDELDVFRGNDRLQFVEGSLSSKASEVSLRIQEASPEIVFIDGAYLIAPDDSWIKSKWERTAAVAEDLKRACLKFSIPIVASYQQSRRAEQKGGSSLSTIGLSDIIGQLSSAVFDISIEDAEASESFEQMDSNRPDSRVLSSLKLREGGFLNFRVSFDLTRMLIEQVEVISSSEE